MVKGIVVGSVIKRPPSRAPSRAIAGSDKRWLSSSSLGEEFQVGQPHDANRQAINANGKTRDDAIRHGVGKFGSLAPDQHEPYQPARTQGGQVAGARVAELV